MADSIKIDAVLFFVDRVYSRRTLTRYEAVQLLFGTLLIVSIIKHGESFLRRIFLLG